VATLDSEDKRHQEQGGGSGDARPDLCPLVAGTPKMSYLKMEYNDVDLSQGKNSSILTIDYTQYNFMNEPCRMFICPRYPAARLHFFWGN